MEKRLTRRDLLRAGAAAGLGLGAGLLETPQLAQAGSQPARKHPNILFIMVDEMRCDVMGCAGHPVVRTPNLDALARQGVRFAHSYSVAPVCCPARRSAFTGRYAHVHGVTTNGMPANPGQILITSILKHYGYATAVSGKLHFNPENWDYDFDQFWSYGAEGPGQLESYPQYLQRKYGSPGKWPKKPGSCPWPDDPLGKDLGEFLYPKEDFESFWITDRSVDFLRSRQGSDQPWFLFTSYLIPHSPYTTPQPYHSMYPPDSFSVPQLPPNAADLRAARPGMAKRSIIADEAMLRAITAQYLGHATNVDDNVGRLLAELEKLGMAGDTIIVFTADHGNMLGDRGRMFKGVMYEGSSHIPHLMRAAKNAPYAERFNTGRVVEEIVETVDLLPTLLEMADLPVPEAGIQGRSLLKLVLGEDKNWKNRAFAALATAMIRTPEFKLIDNRKEGPGRYELYDMRNDPKEERDLSGEAQYKDLVADLAPRIAAWSKETPPPIQIAGMPTPSYAEPLDPKLREELMQRIKKRAQSKANWTPPGKTDQSGAPRRPKAKAKA